jgi:HSP20 family molecular chaperone IbpA
MSTYSGNMSAYSGITIGNWYTYPAPTNYPITYINYIQGDIVKNWDYKTTDTEYTYTLDLPGHDKVKVEKIGQDTLVLEGYRNDKRTYQNFALQPDSDFAKGTASYKNGVLVVTVPRNKPTPQLIEVKFE